MTQTKQEKAVKEEIRYSTRTAEDVASQGRVLADLLGQLMKECVLLGQSLKPGDSVPGIDDPRMAGPVAAGKRVITCYAALVVDGMKKDIELKGLTGEKLAGLLFQVESQKTEVLRLTAALAESQGENERLSRRLQEAEAALRRGHAVV
jgi:hypothetical protein